MKNALMAALVLFLAVPQAVSAQAKTDPSGTWTFDEAKSDPAPARASGGGGGGRGGGRMGGTPATAMTIKQAGGEITINSKEIYGVQGNVLTIETTHTTPAGDQTRKLVYTKN